METDSRPPRYYVMQYGRTLKIERMTESEALKRLSKGSRWIGVGYKTREEAESARQGYLSE